MRARRTQPPRRRARPESLWRSVVDRHRANKMPLSLHLRLLLLQILIASATWASKLDTLMPKPMAAVSENRVLSRQRRFFFPSASGWSLTLYANLAIPLQDVGTSLYICLPFSYAFDTGTVTGRSFGHNEEKRYRTLQTIEAYVSRMAGGNGHDCVLRSICETALTPSHADGLLGELMNLMLLPSYLLEKVPLMGESDYLQAQRRGQYQKDCSFYHEKCPKSFFTFEDVDPEQRYYEDYYTHFGSCPTNNASCATKKP